MIVIFKNNANPEQVKQLCAGFEAQGLKIHNSEGEHTHLIGLIGDTSSVDIDLVRANDFVEDVKRVSEPYKKANRKFHPEDTVIEVGGARIGGGHFSVMAGPCSVESESQIVEVARDVQRSGAGILRGGAFKPRTSPYAFQGMRAEGLELLREARAATGLPIVTEIMNTEHVPLFADVDMIQVGARNMQNFELLKELGKLQTPVLLKRGLANTIEEFLMSAEYIMAGGNENVVLCERGIRTFETSMRNTLDISAVPMLKSKTHLPVVIGPSHAAGIAWMVEPLAMAAIAAGADGLMIEVHNDPENAWCDGAESITPETFDHMMKKLREKHKDDKEALNKEMMQLYKTYKVNPAGGCLPIVVQIPVFIGLYQALLNSIELRHASFIEYLPFTHITWLADLSAADPFYITPLLMGASMFLQQRLTPAAGDPTQQKVMMFMPVIFTVMFINFPAGLVIYWLCNNILSIGQQWWMLRKA